jgi:hypothetical protein
MYVKHGDLSLDLCLGLTRGYIALSLTHASANKQYNNDLYITDVTKS